MPLTSSLQEATATDVTDKIPAAITVDFEDYRRQELRDHLGREMPANPQEVERQLNLLLALLDACDCRATFFSVGRLTEELPHNTWARILRSHRVGCHGHEHLRVDALGPDRFLRDLVQAKQSLEDKTGTEVISFRAPYFSVDGCDPWYGEALAAAGFTLDSSSRRPLGKGRLIDGTMPVPGSDRAVVSVPLPSIGFGGKRVTIIGGTYFRLLPVTVIDDLLHRAHRAGFLPMVYLHPYDIDGFAAPLEYPQRGYRRQRWGDRIRRYGRRGAGDKLKYLAERFQFAPLEDRVPGSSSTNGMAAGRHAARRSATA